MTPKIEYRSSALADAESARDWYESKVAGLGDRFAALLNHTVRRIQQFPEIGREVYPGVRRFLVPVFKYRVYYVIEPERTVIIAVYHPSRDVPHWDDII